MKRLVIFIICMELVACGDKKHQEIPGKIVVQTDFGVKDGAVAAMRGVALEVDPSLMISDLTHEIPPFDIWEAAYRLNQVISYWPANTVFVSVVDPGVGTERRSIVVKTKKDHYIVTPDNGTLTLVAETEGIAAVRLIDEEVNRRQGSEASYTFHGRDVYIYTAARLASGKISFAEVGPVLQDALTTFPYQHAEAAGGIIKGNIPVLDGPYGNVWTNIPDSILKNTGIKTGDSLDIRISFKDSLRYTGRIFFANTFGDVPEGQPLGYINSLMNFSVAINMGNFADRHAIKNGPDWNIQLQRR
jgi:S-adenosylmethionine hydrolase